MAFIELHKQKLKHNFEFLRDFFQNNDVEWGIVTKLLCGNADFLKLLIDLGAKELHDSRISNLETIKKLKPAVQTVYIKPAPNRSLRRLIQFADVSFNTELSTIKLLSAEAVRQNRLHKIIIMVELGDLREGVLLDDLVDFYGAVKSLPNIEIAGLGSNLNCLNGVMPSYDKLMQLSLLRALLEARHDSKIQWISGGTSVTIPLLQQKLVPKGINHFRVGESLYFGNDLVTDKPIAGMEQDIFTLYAEIIELTEKPVVPIGEVGKNVAGETPEFSMDDRGKSSHRAILDLGLLDISFKDLIPFDQDLTIEGGSSDMTIVDLSENTRNYKVGDLIAFKINYMGALRILNSDYIDKKVVD